MTVPERPGFCGCVRGGCPYWRRVNDAARTEERLAASWVKAQAHLSEVRQRWFDHITEPAQLEQLDDEEEAA